MKINDSFFPITDIYTHFNRVININEFESWIRGIIEQIFEYSNNQQNIRNKEIVDKVKAFIKENIINQDISLNTVADYFYLSPNYLSKIFKQETNMSFIDYLVETRLQVSKDLLLSGKLTVEEIASLVGYSSPQYFIKKFKCRFGKTPKQYQIESSIS